MAQKRYYWLKLHEDFFRQKEIKKLRQIAGGDTYTIIYLKLLLLSLKTEGKLFYDGVEADFSSEMALEIDEAVENVAVTVQFLVSCGILQRNTEEEYEILSAAEMVGSEVDSAKRVRDFRKRKRLQSNADVLQCNTCVTAEKEIETRERISLSDSASGAPDEERKKPVFDHETKAYKLAAWLDAQIAGRLSHYRCRTEAQLQKWAHTFDLINRTDGIDWDDMFTVLSFSQRDDFWRTNILSADKFRKRFVQLEAKMKREAERDD